ncbi:transcriptional regulator ATRX-like [Dendronephthya gigantea]|uniref:transcriptional regulator ATRX-like n=1 Tax=Dendronephthya gigantea TaxID=151771 RepID=UPI001068DA43|nr:transcriptional regulator ATRX-like [Dendronephthya gigantea]
MAEKSFFETAQSNYLSVIINFNNLRFMTLVKDNALISDLMKEIEKTYSKLCSAKVNIKTLKNSANAVLPSWYPIAPLVKNQDEIYAFSGDATEVFGIHLRMHGNTGPNDVVMPTISPSASLLRTDSGFTSPLTKPGTSGERDGSPEITGVNEGYQGQQLISSDRNVSQDEGNELLSEIFSFKGNTPKKNEENSGKDNIEVERIIPQGSKSIKETKNSPRKRDGALGVQSSSVGGKALDKGKDTAVVLPEKTASSCDGSSWGTDYSSEKGKKDKTKQTQPEKNKSLKSEELRKDPNKKSQQLEPSEKNQMKKNPILKIQVKRKSSSRTKTVEKDHKSDSSDTSTDDEDFDKDLGNKKASVVNTQPTKSKSPFKKPAEDSSKKEKRCSENMEDGVVDGVRKEFSKKTAAETVSKDTLPKPETMDSESWSDSSSESEVIIDKKVDVVQKTSDKTTEGEAEKSKDRKNNSPKVSAKKGNISISGQKKKQLGNTKEKVEDSSSSGSDISRSDSEKEDSLIEKKGDKNKNDGITESSWSTSEDEETRIKTITKDKNETKQNDRSDKRNPNHPTSVHKKMEGNTMNSKEKNEVKTNEKNKQTNLKIAPSPAKSVRSKKGKEDGTTNMAKSPANTKTRGKENTSAKNETDHLKREKLKGKEIETQSNSESSLSTLKPPFTQLSAKEKIKTSEDNAAKKGDEIIKTPKSKRKHSLADEGKNRQQLDDSNIWSSQSPSKSQKSSVMSSASKVASWLLSNPVLDTVDDGVPSNDSPNKRKKHSKNKSKGEAPGGELGDAQKTKSDSKNKTNEESTVNDIESAKTKDKNQAQKRKMEDNSKEKQGNKKNKKNKLDEKDGKQEIEEKVQDKQENTPIKPEKSSKRKNTLLSLPKVSKGLSALMEDESDYNRKSNNKGKKSKLIPPAVTREVKSTGFLTPSDSVARKTSGSKTPKSRIKKISSSQPSKTIELNAKEKEFLDNGALNLETLLNDESIKW